jgi:indole-3-glycerol phosphate synthase
LLIVRLLSREQLTEFIKISTGMGMACLVEVHSREELETALEAGADIIGVNNRNLQDFTVTLHVAEELSRFFPADIIRVAESGIHTREDIERLREAGYNNFLVGEALMTSDNPAMLLRSLIADD